MKYEEIYAALTAQPSLEITLSYPSEITYSQARNAIVAGVWRVANKVGDSLPIKVTDLGSNQLTITAAQAQQGFSFTVTSVASTEAEPAQEQHDEEVQ